jgi:hypothetical protein
MRSGMGSCRWKDYAVRHDDFDFREQGGRNGDDAMRCYARMRGRALHAWVKVVGGVVSIVQVPCWADAPPGGIELGLFQRVVGGGEKVDRVGDLMVGGG